MTPSGYVYALKDPITLEIRYIGQTIRSLKERLRKHISDAGRSDRHICRWLLKLKNDGQTPLIELIGEYPINQLDEIEINTIAKYRSSGVDLTNTSLGGQATRVFSDETKTKISNALKGKVQSAETRQKRSDSSIKTWSSPELRQMKREQTIVLYRTGVMDKIVRKPQLKKERPPKAHRTKDQIDAGLKKLMDGRDAYFQSKDNRRKMAIANGGKPFGVYEIISLKKANRFRREVEIVKGELIVKSVSINEMAEKFNIERGNIKQCLQGKRNYAGNYIFKYL